MSKFAIGDLVTLSSAGRKSYHNHRVLGMVGIVIKKAPLLTLDICPIKIKWIGLKSKMTEGVGMFPMKEWEIKFAKNGVYEEH